MLTPDEIHKVIGRVLLVIALVFTALGVGGGIAIGFFISEAATK